MQEALTAIKSEKASGLVVTLVVLLAWIGYTWAGDKFVTQAESDTKTQELKDLIKTNAETAKKALSILELHVKDFDKKQEADLIVEASNAVRDVKLEIRLAQLDPSTTDRELRELNESLAHAEEYKECLVNQRPNCEHVRRAE